LISLRKMRTEEFPDYRDYFLEDYTKELMSNYSYSQEYASKYAADGFSRDFPDGPDSPVNELLCIDNGLEGDTELVGYLWHSIHKNEPTAFIHDFYIHEAHRSKGFGRQAIYVLEKLVLSIGIKELKLRVAYYNPRALALYEEIGFTITGINMAKTIVDVK
jgi:GNAT superfamily N-acetyltransferase